MLPSRCRIPRCGLVVLCVLALALPVSRAQELVLAYDLCTNDFPAMTESLSGTTRYLNVAGFYTVSGCAVYADAWNFGNYFYFSFEVNPGHVLTLDRYAFESRTEPGGPIAYNVMVGNGQTAFTSISGGWQGVPGQGEGTYAPVVADNGGLAVTGLTGTVEIRVYGEGAAGIADLWWHRAMRVYGIVEAAAALPGCVAALSPADGEGFVDPSVPLRWTASPLASGYEIYLGTDNPPSNLASGAPVGGTTSFSSSNLAYGTTFYWTVVPTNAAGAAVGCPVWSFTTRPDPSTLSCVYTQTFDAFPEGITGGEVAEGWTNAAGDDGDWTVGSGATPSGETGPSADHTTGTGRYLFTEASSNGSPGSPYKSAYLVSPPLATTGLVSRLLTFWYHMYGEDVGELHVDVYAGGSWHLDAMPALSGDMGDQWLPGIVDLSAYSSPVQVRFRAITGDGFAGDLAIDDVQLCGSTGGDTPTPARIVGFAIAPAQATLTIGDLIAGATTIIERSPAMGAADWTEAGRFVAGGSSTNWVDGPPAEWTRAAYRVRSQ